ASWRGDDEEEIDRAEMEEFIRSDPRARRTLAYLEIGRRADAREELRTGLRTELSERGRRLWAALGRIVSARTTGPGDDARRIDADRYPQPLIQPNGGFTIERSLVYAIARKETEFNARA